MKAYFNRDDIKAAKLALVNQELTSFQTAILAQHINDLEYRIKQAIPKSKVQDRVKELETQKKLELKSLRGYDRNFAANQFDTKITELERLLGDE